MHGIDPENDELDDTLFGPFLQGPKHKKRMKETKSVRQMMCNMGWADPLDMVHFTLNKEQERAFRIITNHAVSKNPEQFFLFSSTSSNKNCECTWAGWAEWVNLR